MADGQSSLIATGWTFQCLRQSTGIIRYPRVRERAAGCRGGMMRPQVGRRWRNGYIDWRRDDEVRLSDERLEFLLAT